MVSERFHTHNFTVEGQGEFPLDMLRHDRCWPSQSVDADKMEDRRTDKGVVMRRDNLVTRTRPGQALATPDRWRSFGWRIVEINGKELHHG